MRGQRAWRRTAWLIIVALSGPAAGFTASRLHLSSVGCRTASSLGLGSQARPRLSIGSQSLRSCSADGRSRDASRADGRSRDASRVVDVRVKRTLAVSPQDARAAWLSYQWAGGGGLPVHVCETGSSRLSKFVPGSSCPQLVCLKCALGRSLSSPRLQMSA